MPEPPEPRDLADHYRTSAAYLERNIGGHDAAYFRPFLDRVEREIPVGARLLDLGCGTGRSSRLLAERGYRVTGVDVSELFLDRANETAGVSLLAADARRLPFADGEFDAVAAYEFIEHVADVDGVLDEVVRVTASGGRILILSPNLLSPFLPLRAIGRLLRGRPNRSVEGTTVAAAAVSLARNVCLSVLKAVNPGDPPRYRVPDLDHPEIADADSVYLATQLDLARAFRRRGLTIVGGSRGHSAAGRVVATMFPNACGECCVVAVKP